MYDVICFGSATIDNFIDTFDRKHLTEAQKKMRYKHMISYSTGDKILIREMNTSIGGGGTNTALTFKRFNHTTAYCGAIGNDSNALIIKDYLKKQGIDFVGHTVEDNSGYSVILDSIEHDRTILTYKGSNDKLSLKKLDLEKFSGAKLFYFSSLLNGSFETQKKILQLAEQYHIKVAFNPSSYQACQGHEALKDVLSKTNYLILNKEEAQDLAKTENPHHRELLILLKKYLAKESTVIITDGKSGAYAYDGFKAYHIIPNPLQVVESTGAGDAFASGFMSGILHGKAMQESLQLAMANSQSVIMHKGAKEKILTYEEAQDSVKKNKFKVVEI